MKLKLGVIGLSEGNGHPYSWSAIFNGYNREEMEYCGFPVIPRYLEQQQWPDSRIPDTEVVAIWTQDANLSEQVAKAAKIPTIVSNPEDMIGKVDAVLLARDDAENHFKFAASFLKAGLPIYIDKPIALSLSNLKKLYELEQYSGQIFTCSALRYSKELMLTDQDYQAIGTIRNIVAYTPKSWSKYAVHIIEPVLRMLPKSDRPVSFYGGHTNRFSGDTSASLIVNWHSGIETTFSATGDGVTPISIRVIGTKGYKDLHFSDSFSAFKSALEDFVQGVRDKSVKSPRNFNQSVVKILEKGTKCHKQY